MILEGKIEIGAPAARAWDFLLDMNRFASCVPGLEKAARIDERSFEGVVSAAAGPISGKFIFQSTILESRPPSEIVVQTEGTDSVTRSAVSARLTVHLDEPRERKTDLSYRADIRINGRLAILGDMVLRATGALLLEEFGRRLKEQLEK